MILSLMSCTEPFIDGRIDLDMFDDINMRVINDSDIDFTQVLIVPCFNSSDNMFFSVNSSDTTEYRAFECGFHETIVEVLIGNSSLKREPIDYISPLNAGNYDCIINVSGSQNLEVQIKLSEN